MEEDTSAFKILTGLRPLGRPKRKWEDNIRKNLKEMGSNTQDCGVQPSGPTSHSTELKLSFRSRKSTTVGSTF